MNCMFDGTQELFMDAEMSKLINYCCYLTIQFSKMHNYCQQISIYAIRMQLLSIFVLLRTRPDACFEFYQNY